MTDEFRTWVRSNIRPFSTPIHVPTQRFQTGWAGMCTFDQIMHDCTPLAAALMRKHGVIDPGDFPDALQRGFMVLWERLVKNPQLLALDDKIIAASTVDANSGCNYWKRHQRHVSLDDLKTMGVKDHPDEWMLSGFESERSERWAAWATAADLRIDIERAMHGIANEYLRRSHPHGFRLLVALYYLTTEVGLKDAALIAGINHHYLLDDYASQVRRDVRVAFADLYRPNTRWIDKYKRGVSSPAIRVMGKYQRNPDMIAAIQSLLEERSPQDAPHVRSYHRMRARRALEAAYCCAS